MHDPAPRGLLDPLAPLHVLRPPPSTVRRRVVGIPRRRWVSLAALPYAVLARLEQAHRHLTWLFAWPSFWWYRSLVYGTSMDKGTMEVSHTTTIIHNAQGGHECKVEHNGDQ